MIASSWARACRAGAAGLVLALLGACGANQDELRSWMATQKQTVRPNVEPLLPPKKFEPQAYTALSVTEPFGAQKLSIALRQEARQPSSLLASELRRRRQPLEAFPLDSMVMVGSLVRQGRTFALLRVDNLLHQVKAGDYLGQNYGRITKITETEIGLREVVQDAAGEWIERTATLQLQEKAR